MSRTVVVAGNWKMNHGPLAAVRFLGGLDSAGSEADTFLAPGFETLLFPPSVSLHALVNGASTRGISVGVQNVHWEEQGAFTGEISAPMAVEAGATHTLVGHSERRHVFGETDDETGRKVRSALAAGLVVVLCVGETLEERRVGKLREVLTRQVRTGLDPAIEAGLATAERLYIAYEPVWAIGTGETATPADASEAHAWIRRELASPGSESALVADDVSILYGGSVKPANAAELMRVPDVDGVLVGGASLDPESFLRIVDSGLVCARGTGDR